jgi:hypothetical protein
MAKEKNCCALCGKTPYWVFQTKNLQRKKNSTNQIKKIETPK